jgi:hypothetical protein
VLFREDSEAPPRGIRGDGKIPAGGVLTKQHTVSLFPFLYNICRSDMSLPIQIPARDYYGWLDGSLNELSQWNPFWNS